jgi:hypothetical protein
MKMVSNVYNLLAVKTSSRRQIQILFWEKMPEFITGGYTDHFSNDKFQEFEEGGLIEFGLFQAGTTRRIDVDNPPHTYNGSIEQWERDNRHLFEEIKFSTQGLVFDDIIEEEESLEINGVILEPYLVSVIKQLERTRNYFVDIQGDIEALNDFEPFNPFLIGEQGVGKSKILYAFAEYLDYDIVEIDCSGIKYSWQFLYTMGFDENNNLVKEPTDFVKKLENPNTLFIFEELRRVDSTFALNSLLSILDWRRSITIKEFGETLTMHPSSLIIASGNENIEGDSNFSGNVFLDDAISSRFTPIVIKNLSPEYQVKLLTRTFGEEQLVTKIVEISEQARKEKLLPIKPNVRQLKRVCFAHFVGKRSLRNAFLLEFFGTTHINHRNSRFNQILNAHLS